MNLESACRFVSSAAMHWLQLAPRHCPKINTNATIIFLLTFQWRMRLFLSLSLALALALFSPFPAIIYFSFIAVVSSSNIHFSLYIFFSMSSLFRFLDPFLSLSLTFSHFLSLSPFSLSFSLFFLFFLLFYYDYSGRFSIRCHQHWQLIEMARPTMAGDLIETVASIAEPSFPFAKIKYY